MGTTDCRLDKVLTTTYTSGRMMIHTNHHGSDPKGYPRYYQDQQELAHVRDQEERRRVRPSRSERKTRRPASTEPFTISEGTCERHVEVSSQAEVPEERGVSSHHCSRTHFETTDYHYTQPSDVTHGRTDYFYLHARHVSCYYSDRLYSPTDSPALSYAR